MRKILVIITTEFVSHGGLTTVMMNYLGHMDRAQLKIDIASTNDPDEETLKKLTDWGIGYVNLGTRKKNTAGYLRNLCKHIRTKKYDVIHVNGNSATMGLELIAALLCRVPHRIAHGHTTRSNYPVFHKLLTPLFCLTYTDSIATSEAAGKWLYGTHYTVLNNAIDVEHYSFSQEIRDRVRRDLFLQGKFVVGNVGKLNPPKNHRFLMDVFCEVRQKCENAVLVVAGGGELEAELKAYAAELEIENDVIFLGMVDDTREVLQAMDVFVFPSRFEGLGMAMVEAQAAGLECIASTAVPREAKVSDYVQFCGLDEPHTYWAEKILQTGSYDRVAHAHSAAQTIRECGYDIRLEADKLKILYLKESR